MMISQDTAYIIQIYEPSYEESTLVPVETWTNYEAAQARLDQLNNLSRQFPTLQEFRVICELNRRELRDSYYDWLDAYTTPIRDRMQEAFAAIGLTNLGYCDVIGPKFILTETPLYKNN